MPAPPQVSTQAIVNALLEWEGDVSAAARRLGMARNSLYERITRLGLNLEAFRKPGASKRVIPIAGVPGVQGMTGNTGNAGRAEHAQQNDRANYPARAAGRKFSPVQATQTDEADVPIKTAPRRYQPLRLRPDLREIVRNAAWQLQARFHAPTDENLILEQFIEEGFAEWLAAKLAPAAAEQPARSRKRGEGEGSR